MRLQTKFRFVSPNHVTKIILKEIIVLMCTMDWEQDRKDCIPHLKPVFAKFCVSGEWGLHYSDCFISKMKILFNLYKVVPCDQLNLLSSGGHFFIYSRNSPGASWTQQDKCGILTCYLQTRIFGYCWRYVSIKQLS